MIDPGVEVYRSLWRRSCEDRAFMLGAVGIASTIVLRDGYFTLEVADPDAQRALSHLTQYEAENRPPPPTPPPPPFHSNAWVGCSCAPSP